MSADSLPPDATVWPASLQDGGTCGALLRSIDWAQTPVGPVASWPMSLKSIVGMLLHSRHPMFLWWGPELTQFYNDAYLPSFGQGKHPAAMGQAGRDTWEEIWPLIWPQIEAVMREARPSWNEDHLVPIWRNGRIEEVFWTYGYSPVFDEQDRVAGTLVVCTETTPRVVAERRLQTLRAIDERAAVASDARGVLQASAAVLQHADADVPFALLYRVAARSREVQLHATVGVSGEVALSNLHPQLSAALSVDTGRATQLALQALPLPTARWPEPVTEAFVVPLRKAPSSPPNGFAVFGLSPRLQFDDLYRDYLTQLAEHIALAEARVETSRIRSAMIHERNNLLLQAPVATALLIGAEHSFELANPRYCEMVGQSDLVGKTYRQAFPHHAETGLPAILDRVYQTGQPHVTDELCVPIVRDVGGEPVPRFFSFNLEPLRDANGDVYGMMAVTVDITDRVNARQILEKAYAERAKLLDELEAANRAKDEFLAMLGHELRNPLSPIVTALQLMKARDTQTAKEQQIIERQVAHLVRLVDDLLDISKITRGKVELRKQRADLREVIHKAVETSAVLFDDRSHQLQLELPEQPLPWLGDPVRLAQVVTNLLTNAARYTERGGRIRLAAWQADQQLVVRVSDNGIGISAELLPHVFELFVQGQRSSDRAQGGLGLGLALVKNLVALHGGSVQARSAGLGQGSEFVIHLPAAADTIESDEAPAQPALRNPLPLKSKRVLVVDDNADAAELLGEVMRQAGHEVMVANDPSSALESLSTFRPQVAVLDIGLPDMDGYQLAARVRDVLDDHACLLIALTGYGQSHDRKRSQQAGFHQHFVKPVNVAELLRFVAEPTRPGS